MGISPYIYGLHDRDGEHLLQGRGWVVVTEAIGANPNDHSGGDYSDLAAKGLGVIVRLNHGYGSAGTIPLPHNYPLFAQRCANFVRNSRGCHIWIIGNEPNHSQERPDGQEIWPEQYAECFRLCRTAIKAVQPDAQVLTAAIAPWNMQSGGWLSYFVAVLRGVECDGITVHTYTHGDDPAFVTSDAKMEQWPLYWHFRAYKDFLANVPSDKRHLPVYITETNQGDHAWRDENRGWVQAAYREIHEHNQSGGQPIRCLVLYRWNDHDHWQISNKPGIQDDLRAAVARGYQWPQAVSLPTPVTPTNDNWGRSIAFVLKHEGGLSSDPNDPGNYRDGVFVGTKYGISAAAHPGVDIVNLTEEEAKRIYFESYWKSSGANSLPWPLCLAVFDQAVNGGVASAKKILAESGPDFHGFMAQRLRWYTNVSNFDRYGRAYVRRCADVLREAAK